MSEITIVGCGVSGLTCGIVLQEAGYTVKIVARDLPPFTTSNIAGAIWYPYRAYPIERALRWGRTGYEQFERLLGVPEAGVKIVTLVEPGRQPIADPWWREVVRAFRRCTPDELPTGFVDGYTFDVPLVETPIYMPYLLNRFQRGGGQIEQRTLSDFHELDAPLIINCAGLGSRELAGDEKVYPIRGQVARIDATQIGRGWMEESDPDYPIYIFPRSRDCIIGGTALKGNWSREVDTALAETMLKKAQWLEPDVAKAKVLEHLVGLRPGREAVRLEKETLASGQTVIHDYGHGGAGFTLSWGCAREVLEIVKLVALD